MSSYVTIPFRDSEIKGIEKTSLNDKKYYAFLGIPYAEPPLENLRFKNPQAIKNFPKYIDATQFKKSCIQYNELHETRAGCEDCLYLNIFISKLPPFDSLLPVMVYFHGGAYRALAANAMTPHLLIEYDIIIVTFNFRLHVLGFLDLGLPECSGNMGLKDQLCALQWVKNNIKYFGGDADNITILGISSGAACAQMVTMSPLNKDLVNRIILVGGNALNTWHVNPNPEKVAFELGRKFGYEGDDKKTLLKLLKSVSADELLDAVLTLYDENLLLPRGRSFRPTVERIKEGALLPDLPLNLWKKVKHISIINGINEHEGTFFLRVPKFAEQVVRFDALKVFISDITSVEENFLDNMFKEIISFYGITEKDNQESYNAKMTVLSTLHISTLNEFQQLFTDVLLKHYYVETDFIRPPSNSYSVYNYKFTYRGDHNIITNAWKRHIKGNFKETFHGDDVGYLLIQTKWYLPEKDKAIANTICELWTNFIKYGTPNGEIFNKWVPSTKEMPCYLQIGEDLSMKNEDFNSDRAKFWKYLYDKYALL